MDSLRPFRMFLAHSFAEEKWNPLAERDPHGISDRDLADMVAHCLVEFSHGQIEVVRTRDPFHNYVSSEVRQDICRSDGVLCLFTKRIEDCITRTWIPSTYVISEGSAALMQFATEEETHRRLFGLVEDGVDGGHLGMAFHGNKPAPRFRRDDLEGLQSQVRRIVETILGNRDGNPVRDDFEYLLLAKVVSVWRSGGVLVETRHRFRSTTEKTRIEIPHKVWRVSKELPSVNDVLEGSPRTGSGFLRVMPLRCGSEEPPTGDCNIKPDKETAWGYERKFVVEFRNVHIRPGEELEYEIVWGYNGAFHNRRSADANEETPNSVGLTTDGRGRVREASLTLKFQRDLDGELNRTIEGPPTLFTTDTPDLPGAHSPREFFHKDRSWKRRGDMQHSRKQSCTLFDVYHWSTGPFHGMLKAVWTPHLNYFDADDTPLGVARDESTTTEEDVGELEMDGRHS